MILVGVPRLEDFARSHPDARGPLDAWATVVRAVTWRNLLEARRTYSHADPVVTERGTKVTVFNVGGNKYRLIAAIDYKLGIVNVRAVLTHAEYDKAKWKKTI